MSIRTLDSTYRLDDLEFSCHGACAYLITAGSTMFDVRAVDSFSAMTQRYRGHHG